MINDWTVAGVSALPFEVNAKVCVTPLKDPEISSIIKIWLEVDGVKLIHTVPFHWYENPETLSVYIWFSVGLSGKLRAIILYFLGIYVIDEGLDINLSSQREGQLGITLGLS